LKISGYEIPIAEHVGHHAAMGPMWLYSVSQTGVLAYRTRVLGNVPLVWHSRDGQRLQSIGEPREYRQITLSPDEKRLAVEIPSGRDAGGNIWTVDLSTGIFSRLTFDASG